MTDNNKTHEKAQQLFYQPFDTCGNISCSSRQRDFHVSLVFVAIAGQVPDLIVH